MGPLEPYAASLCFFSKLVLQNGAQVVRDVRAFPCRSVLPGRGLPPSARVCFATENASEMAAGCRGSPSNLENSPADARVCLGFLALLSMNSAAILQLGGGNPKPWWACCSKLPSPCSGCGCPRAPKGASPSLQGAHGVLPVTRRGQNSPAWTGRSGSRREVAWLWWGCLGRNRTRSWAARSWRCTCRWRPCVCSSSCPLVSL